MSWIGQLTSLAFLSLANNKFVGSIPKQIGELSLFTDLDIADNFLSDEIPVELENLNLNHLNLSHNKLSESIPPSPATTNYNMSFVGNPDLCRDVMRHGRILLPILLCVCAVVFSSVIVGLFLKYWKYKKSKSISNILNWRWFYRHHFNTFEIVKSLKAENIIGRGESSDVYKVLLSHGEIVAVKKLRLAKKDE